MRINVKVTDHRLLAIAWMVVLTSGSSVCYAADLSKAGLRELRRQVLELRFKVITQEAECEALLQENKLIANPFSDGEGSQKESPDGLPITGTWDKIFHILKSSGDKRLEALDKLSHQVARERDDAAIQWRRVTEALLAFVDQMVDAETRYGLTSGTELGSGPFDRTGKVLLLCGLPVIAFGWVFTIHEARQNIRRRVRGRVRIWVLFLISHSTVLTGCSEFNTSSGVDAPQAALDRQAELLTAEAKQLQDKEGNLVQKLANARAEAERNRHRLIETRIDALAPSAGPRRSIADGLGAMESAAQVKIEKLLIDSFINKRLAKSGLEQLDELEWRRRQLDERVAEMQSGSLGRGAVRLGLCAGIIGLAFVPLVTVRRRNRRQQMADAARCPRCLSARLKVIAGKTRDARYREPCQMECPACKYQFREMYRNIARQCFGVVGIRGSGKTHWLVTAYEQIKNGHVATRAALQKIPSDADARFELNIKEVLESHQQMHPTPPQLSSPLMFSVRDLDRWGRTPAMMNIFDFGGAVMTQDIYASEVRRRALMMDGFILFLDPTQLRAHDVDLGIDSQILALTQFHEELRDLRRIRIGQTIPIPVAVCVSKLDLLLNRNPLGSRSRALVKALRGTFSDQSPLRTLHARSRLLSRELALIFPGWKLQRTLRENFGNRFLFFPLTPVGLEEEELGEEDLKRRTFAPFGILEPLLWLLHMKGYCVF